MADKQRYKVLIGLNYPPNNRRAGIGSVIDDLPQSDIADLVAMGAIEPTDEPVNRIDDDAAGMVFGEAIKAPGEAIKAPEPEVAPPAPEEAPAPPADTPPPPAPTEG